MKKKIIFILTFIVISFVILTGEHPQASAAEDWPGLPTQEEAEVESLGQDTAEPYEWPISTPEEQGLDSGIFARAYKEVEKMPFLHSLLVIKNGYLVAERYFYYHDRRDAADIGSVSKSMISALVGIALKEGYLTGLEQKMLDSFPEYIYKRMNPRKYDITLRHLLTMTAAYPSVDTDELWRLFVNSPDWIEYGISLHLAGELGRLWQFSTTSTHLLSAVISRASGMNTREFAEKYLFEPLNISVREWRQDPQGNDTGGFGMSFFPRDLARFGYLYLHKGTVDGQAIVPGEWIDESLHPYIQTSQIFSAFLEEGFGYLWYMGRMSEYDIYFAVGHGGQLVLNIPELDMIIVTTAGAAVSRYDSRKHTAALFEFIAYHMLYPVRDFLGPVPYAPTGVSGRKVKNESLLHSEYINIVAWQPNPRNIGSTITRYRVYLFAGTNKQLLAEVDGNTFEYTQRGLSQGTQYIYGISSVTDDNRESSPAFVFIRYPAPPF